MICSYKNLFQKKNFKNLDEVDNLFSERLSLKLLQKEDLDDITEYMTEEIARNIGGGTPWPYRKIDAENWLKKSLEARNEHDFFNYVIRLKYSNEFIGIISLFAKQYFTCLFPGKVAYWTAEHQRKKGYVLEALKEIEKLYPKYFNLRKIWTTVRAENIPSANLLKKSGFKQTGSRWESYQNSEYIWEHIFEKDL
jgi:RimJ/RimL family protein N-acetyltransferase